MAVTDESFRSDARTPDTGGNGSLLAGATTGDLDWGLCSETGPRREHNEDFAGASVPDDPTAPGPLFAVADGLGGHAAGEIASRTAVEVLLDRWRAGGADDAARHLRACARDANSAVLTASYERGRSGMGTTLTALAVAGRQALIAHVGDSRAYLVRGDACEQLTSDHSRVAEMVRLKLISAERAADHPARSQLTRSLGAAMSLQVDLVRRPVQTDDVFVLCSDGLWDEVARSEVLERVRASRTDPARGVAAALVATAVERGCADNVTAVVVRILNDQPLQAEPRRSLLPWRR